MTHLVVLFAKLFLQFIIQTLDPSLDDILYKDDSLS